MLNKIILAHNTFVLNIVVTRKLLFLDPMFHNKVITITFITVKNVKLTPALEVKLNEQNKTGKEKQKIILAG